MIHLYRDDRQYGPVCVACAGRAAMHATYGLDHGDDCPGVVQAVPADAALAGGTFIAPSDDLMRDLFPVAMAMPRRAVPGVTSRQFWGLDPWPKGKRYGQATWLTLFPEIRDPLHQ